MPLPSCDVDTATLEDLLRYDRALDTRLRHLLRCAAPSAATEGASTPAVHQPHPRCELSRSSRRRHPQHDSTDVTSDDEGEEEEENDAIVSAPDEEPRLKRRRHRGSAIPHVPFHPYRLPLTSFTFVNQPRCLKRRFRPICDQSAYDTSFFSSSSSMITASLPPTAVATTRVVPEFLPRLDAMSGNDRKKADDGGGDGTSATTMCAAPRKIGFAGATRPPHAAFHTNSDSQILRAIINRHRGYLGSGASSSSPRGGGGVAPVAAAPILWRCGLSSCQAALPPSRIMAGCTLSKRTRQDTSFWLSSSSSCMPGRVDVTSHHGHLHDGTIIGFVESLPHCSAVGVVHQPPTTTTMSDGSPRPENEVMWGNGFVNRPSRFDPLREWEVVPSVLGLRAIVSGTRRLRTRALVQCMGWDCDVPLLAVTAMPSGTEKRGTDGGATTTPSSSSAPSPSTQRLFDGLRSQPPDPPRVDHSTLAGTMLSCLTLPLRKACHHAAGLRFSPPIGMGCDGVAARGVRSLRVSIVLTVQPGQSGPHDLLARDVAHGAGDTGSHLHVVRAGVGAHGEPHYAAHEDPSLPPVTVGSTMLLSRHAQTLHHLLHHTESSSQHYGHHNVSTNNAGGPVGYRYCRENFGVAVGLAKHPQLLASGDADLPHTSGHDGAPRRGGGVNVRHFLPRSDGVPAARVCGGACIVPPECVLLDAVDGRVIVREFGDHGDDDDDDDDVRPPLDGSDPDDAEEGDRQRRRRRPPQPSSSTHVHMDDSQERLRSVAAGSGNLDTLREQRARRQLHRAIGGRVGQCRSHPFRFSPPSAPLPLLRAGGRAGGPAFRGAPPAGSTATWLAPSTIRTSLWGAPRPASSEEPRPLNDHSPTTPLLALRPPSTTVRDDGMWSGPVSCRVVLIIHLQEGRMSIFREDALPAVAAANPSHLNGFGGGGGGGDPAAGGLALVECVRFRSLRKPDERGKQGRERPVEEEEGTRDDDDQEASVVVLLKGLARAAVESVEEW